VQGFVQAISYTDGAFVKKGTSLFTIEPEPYRLKVIAAKAVGQRAKATLTQNEADFQRQADLLTKQVSAQVTYDKALATRDSSQADLQSAQANEQQAEINLGYTDVTAPFDGVVTARQVSIGQLVGANSPTALATHRADGSDLGEFQRQRTRSAADPRQSGEPRRNDNFFARHPC
jgi:RND family efflux transporter MFP subunit